MKPRTPRSRPNLTLALAVAVATTAANALPASLVPPCLAGQLPQAGGQGAGTPGAGSQGPGGSAERLGPGMQQPLVPPEAEYRDPLDPVWMRHDTGQQFQGFPTFPSRLFGYGTYPGQTAPGGLGDLRRPPMLPPALSSPPGWPVWVRTRSEKPLPYAPEVGLLIRHGDRVWYQDAGEPAAVPLYHFDKFRALAAGAVVEVRHEGNFELLLHESTRLVAAGPTRLRLVELTPELVRLEVLALTRLDVSADGRAHVITLPDGSELRLAATGADEAAEGPAVVQLLRADEPACYGGRATLANRGNRALLWHTAHGDVRLDRDHRTTLFLTPPPATIALPLAAEGIQMTPDGQGAAGGRSPGGGEVRWCGAAFVVPAGGTLRFDSLLGDAFRRAAAAPAAAASTP